MNIREYLATNKLPLLNNPKSILILELLEINGFCTALEISNYTSLSLQETNEILQILYYNKLIELDEEIYKITINGIKLLNTLGFSDLRITDFLKKADFKSGEYAIYKSLFQTWRTDFPDFYLGISGILEKSYDIICEPYLNILPSKKATYSLFIALVVHEFAYVLYTDERSSLMNQYNDLFDYCYVNYCYSSEIYHRNSKHWNSNNAICQFSKNIKDPIHNLWIKTFSTINRKKSQNNEHLLISDIQNYLNIDFELSHKITTNNELLHKIFISQNLQELSVQLNCTEYQAKFILKSIRAKIEKLLPNDMSVDSTNFVS